MIFQIEVSHEGLHNGQVLMISCKNFHFLRFFCQKTILKMLYSGNNPLVVNEIAVKKLTIPVKWRYFWPGSQNFISLGICEFFFKTITLRIAIFELNSIFWRKISFKKFNTPGNVQESGAIKQD